MNNKTITIYRSDYKNHADTKDSLFLTVLFSLGITNHKDELTSLGKSIFTQCISADDIDEVTLTITQIKDF